ncbi:MAG: glycosyltransferase family 4 protein [Gemmatimonadaceae bacterium]|nr:glycosyltransferase family 4 protein [Gloeobacterales cyanobacterium ES-bin-141]
MNVLLSHPTGNTFVRALLTALEQAGILEAFYTTVAVKPEDWYVTSAPSGIRKELLRRTYALSGPKVETSPWREVARLAAARLGLSFLTAHETGWASVDAVWNSLDHYVAQQLPQRRASVVYCYEDAALHTFQAARQLGLKRVYDLPIAHWQTSQLLLREEAERWPEWEPTLMGTRDSVAKLERKSEELALADVVVCPSKFVFDTLPDMIRHTKHCIVAEFGSPTDAPPAPPMVKERHSPLRVLFAGSMSQRKGLADLFAAVKLLDRKAIELVVMGSLLQPIEFYRRQHSHFTYESTRPHHEVLQLMQSCDLLVLPSIVEGRALVQQEAMVCGLPLIVTPNAGGEDLIDPGETGFLVPIRSPRAIAEKLAWFADNREQLAYMKIQARHKALQVSWKQYQDKILKAIITSEKKYAS